jgi:hypothetical protein
VLPRVRCRPFLSAAHILSVIGLEFNL